MADSETSVPVLAVTAAVGAVVLLLVLLCGMGKKEQKEEETEETREENGSVKEKKKPVSSKRQRPTERNKKEVKHTFSHKWLASTLKGHSSPVLDMDFSPNGKYLATCAEDRTILLWSVKEFDQRERKSVRANVDLDHAMQVKFSPDNRALILGLYTQNTIRVMKMGKKADGSPGNFDTALDFPRRHESDITNIGIASSGRFIMTSTKETTILIWDLKGEVLATIDSLQMNNSHTAVSPCGRFVGSSGFTPDVKVWEVCFDKSGNFTGVNRAFELKGHKAGVYSFSFNANSTRMASVSKDGTWKTWDTNIEYQKGQEPYLLQTGKYDHPGFSYIAISPDGMAVALSTGCTIRMYDALTTEHAQTFEDAHASPVVALGFDNNSRHLVSAGGKHVHVFHNIVGYRALISDLMEKKKKATNQAQKERLHNQIKEAEAALNSIEAGTGVSS